MEPSILAPLSVIPWKRFTLELCVPTVSCENACVVLAAIAFNSPLQIIIFRSVAKDYSIFLVFNCFIKSVAFVYDLRPNTLIVLAHPWLDSREKLA